MLRFAERIDSMKTIPQLVLTGTGERDTEDIVDLHDSLVVGRGDAADLRVNDVLVSRTHCLFRPEPRGVVVEDLSSQNGTWVNGRLVGRTLLQDGDVVRVGNTSITLRVPRVESIDRALPVADPSAPDDIEFMSKVVGEASLHQFQAQTLMLFSEGRSERPLPGDGTTSVPRRVRALFEAGQLVQRQPDPDEMLAGVLRLLMEALEAHLAAFVVIDEEGEVAVRSAQADDGRVVKPSDVVVSRTVAARVIEGRIGLVRGDRFGDGGIPTTQSIMGMPAGALMVVPVLVRDRVLGLVQVHSRRAGGELDENDLGLASTIASMAGTALENRELALQREEDIQVLRETNANLAAKKRELQEAQDRLLSAERLAAIGQLAAGVAHDGRNALQAMAALSLLKQRYPFDEEVQLYVDLALDGQQMVVELLEEILAFVRQTPREDSVSEVSLSAVVRSMVYLARMDPDLRGRGPHEAAHSLKLVLDAEPMVLADGGRLKQVVLNLIKNAAQAISVRPGLITVRVGRSPEGAFVSVTDDGDGIPAAVQERLFEPLFTTKKERGVGLGLHICRTIAHRHGGTLGFETVLGEGTTFTLTLPTVPTS